MHDLVMAEYTLRSGPAGTEGSVQQFAAALGGVQLCIPQGAEWSPEYDMDVGVKAVAANAFGRKLQLEAGPSQTQFLIHIPVGWNFDPVRQLIAPTEGSTE